MKNNQHVDLGTKQSRANLAALLVGRVLRAEVEPESVSLTLEHGQAVFRIEGSYEDRTLEAQFAAHQYTRVLCRWCGTETKYLGTRECDRCFELHDKLSGADPEILKKMAEEMNILSRMVTDNG